MWIVLCNRHNSMQNLYISEVIRKISINFNCTCALGSAPPNMCVCLCVGECVYITVSMTCLRVCICFEFVLNGIYFNKLQKNLYTWMKAHSLQTGKKTHQQAPKAEAHRRKKSEATEKRNIHIVHPTTYQENQQTQPHYKFLTWIQMRLKWRVRRFNGAKNRRFFLLSFTKKKTH